MAVTLFRIDARVLACELCGAPLEVGGADGRIPCRYCGSEQEIPRRDDRDRPAPPRIPEEERIARLRAQDGRGPPSIESVSGLMLAGRLLPWKVSEALDVWQAARREVRSGARAEAAERLFVLTRALAAHLGEAGEPLRERAVLETALEALAEARHRQVLRATLARSACRDGDRAAAEAWLAACDPASDDLAMDSAYRFARAYLDTAQGAFPRVLAVLGAGHADVPIADELDPACAVLRANAWERTGRADVAVDLLADFKARAGGLGRYEAARFVELHPALRLCEVSEPRAEARQREAALREIDATSGRPWVMLAIAAVFTAVLAGMVVYQAFFGRDVQGVGLLPMWIAVMGVMPPVFGAIGVDSLRKARRARRLRVAGAPAIGRILRARPTGTATMGVPEARYRVLVVRGRAAYEASVILHADQARRARLRRGAMVLVRVDRDDPAAIHLETD
jgi:uncharacterized Zn finger protein (UPF0148 family)